MKQATGVAIVQMALAREQHDRRGAFQNLQVHGHVRIATTEQPAHITVQIEDEFIDDDRERFPTTNLMARLQLAVAAGRSCRNLRDEDIYASTNFDYTVNTGRRSFGKSEIFTMGYGRDMHMGDFPKEPPPLFPAKKRVTAAVKKFAKGLRP